MPKPTRNPSDGSISCTVAPGEAIRIDLAQAGNAAWTLAAANTASNASSTFESVATSEDDAVQIKAPAGISADGSLAAGARSIVTVPSRLRALLVTVPADADGPTHVRVLQ